MNPLRLAATVAFSLALGLASPAIVRAQDAKPAPPGKGGPQKSDADLDRELDESLRRAHGDPHEPPPPYPHEDLAPSNPPVEAPIATEDDNDAGRLRFRLGMMAAHWAARLYDVTISKGRNGNFASNLDLDSGNKGFVTDWDFAETQTFSGWIDLGDTFSLEGGGRNAVFHRDGNANSNLTFGNATFMQGEYLRAKFEYTSADLNLVIHPLNCQWGQIDIYLGARYLWSQVELRGAPGVAPMPGPPLPLGGFPFRFPFRFGSPAPVPGPSDSQSLEAVLPMVGLGGAVRPIHFGKGTYFEIFAHGRVGGIDLENDLKTREYYAISVEAEGGIRFMFGDFIGLVVGYRFELNEIERRDTSSSDMGSKKYAGWKSDGPFGGVVAQF